MSIALRIGKGVVVINGFAAKRTKKGIKIEGEWPEGSVRSAEIILPENALTRPLGDAQYSLLPVDDNNVIREEPYVEVRGNTPRPVTIRANTANQKAAPAANAPISYLHSINETAYSYLELQVNEGCARIAAQ